MRPFMPSHGMRRSPARAAPTTVPRVLRAKTEPTRRPSTRSCSVARRLTTGSVAPNSTVGTSMCATQRAYF
jgi:hypothetical protein